MYIITKIQHDCDRCQYDYSTAEINNYVQSYTNCDIIIRIIRAPNNMAFHFQIAGKMLRFLKKNNEKKIKKINTKFKYSHLYYILVNCQYSPH